MQLPLRRLLNHLPIPHGSGAEMYVRSTWHKPTPFDHCRSQAPFPMRRALPADHFGRGLRRQRILRHLVRWSIAIAIAWIVIESARAVTVF